MGKKIEKPWEDVMTKEDYDTFTKKMPPAMKKDFDIGLANRDTNTLMDLGARGLYAPNGKRNTKKKKNFSL